MKYLLYPHPIDNHSTLPLSGMIILKNLYNPYPVWNLLKLTYLHLAYIFVENLNLAFSGLFFEIDISDQH